VSFLLQPFALNGGLKIPCASIRACRPGTIIALPSICDPVPSNEVPNVAEIKTRQDYYQIDWPVVTRQRQIGVYAEEVLAIYAPFAMASSRTSATAEKRKLFTERTQRLRGGREGVAPVRSTSPICLQD